MSVIKTFIAMFIGIVLAPPLASGITTVLNDSNISGTPAAAIVGAILTFYAIFILYGGAKSMGLV